VHLAELERAKRRIIANLTDDAILDYDIKTDTANLSEGFRTAFSVEETSVSGFRHFILSREELDRNQCEQVLSDIIKLNRRTSELEADLDVKRASGDCTLRVHITALFESDAEDAPKAGYVAKLVKI
jgi:hypothetical protein